MSISQQDDVKISFFCFSKNSGYFLDKKWTIGCRTIFEIRVWPFLMKTFTDMGVYNLSGFKYPCEKKLQTTLDTILDEIRRLGQIREVGNSNGDDVRPAVLWTLLSCPT